ncbi:MAG: hypothetical protein HZA49_08135 [Planctomycetes bacterium]|nr:hypothetical protein [Planctomycetota bacterium]
MLKRTVKDNSALSLVAANLVTAIFAIVQKWTLAELMWIYWSQSITIGIFNFIRIWRLKQFRTDGLTMNDRPVEPTEKSKKDIAIFFAMHYGFFHVGYLIFLTQLGSGGRIENLDSTPFITGVPIDTLAVIILALMFFGNHLYSFLHNKDNYRGVPNIGTMMFFPYARVIPMHLTLIIGASMAQSAIILFLFLKTIADVIMHAVEHSLILSKE